MWPVKVYICLGVAAAFDLTILHTNDMHARIEPTSASSSQCTSDMCYGGFARVKAYVDSVRRNSKNVLFLNAGDNFQGSPLFTVHRWKVIAAFIDRLGIDVMSLGNHEFDDSVTGLVPYLNRVKTPSVCCNIDTTGEPSFQGTNLHPWRIINVGNTSIAVIGYLTPETQILARPGDVKFYDEVDMLKRASKEVKEEGAELVIALGHSGWDTDLRIATYVPNVDVVVGGHTNTFLYTGIPPDKEIPIGKYPHIVTQKSGKRVPVVQAYAYTKYVGRLELSFDQTYRLISARGNPVLMSSERPQDVALDHLVDVWTKNMTDILKKEVGTTYVDLNGECRLAECNLGNLLADALVDYGARLWNERKREEAVGWTDAPIAISNGGGIRASIYLNETNGVIRAGQTLTTLPFENSVAKVTMTGTLLYQVLETSVRRYDPTGFFQDGAFLQTSGLRVIYDVTKRPGRRVVRAWVRCGYCLQPQYTLLQDDMIVTVIMNMYIANGGDGFSMLANNTLHREILPLSEYRIFENYVKERSPHYKGLEGRVTVLKSNEDIILLTAASPSPNIIRLLPVTLISCFIRLCL